MLFHIEGFKKISTTGPVLDSAEKLYSLKVLEGKGQQELRLKDELLDKFVFCQVERTTTGFQINLEKRLTASTVGSRMRRGGEITGFDQVAHPYNLRYAGAKAFNSSGVYLPAPLNYQASRIANPMDRGGYRCSPERHSPALRYPHLCPTL